MQRAFLIFASAVILVWSLVGSGAAVSAADDDCFSTQLKAAKVSASVGLKYEGEDYAKADARLIVQVPKSWKFAQDLLLNGDTQRYRAAMRCVLRYPNDPYPYRDTEARPWSPKVTVQEKWITVEHRAITYIDDTRTRDFGPWRIAVGKRFWTLTLIRPPALDRSWWQEVSVDMGGRAARAISPTPTKGSATHLIWTRAQAKGKPLEVQVQVQPPATKALETRWTHKPWYLVVSALWLSWDLVFFVVLLLLTRALHRSHVSSPATPGEGATKRNILLGACLIAAVALIFELDDQVPAVAGDYGLLSWWPEHRVSIHLMLAACGGAGLCIFGRPRIHALVVVTIAAAYPVVIAITPERFGLPATIWLDEENIADIERLQHTGGFFWLAIACACVAFVWLVGTVALLRRLQLAPRLITQGTPQRGNFPWWVLILCSFAATAIVTLVVWAHQNTWEQETWLSIGSGDAQYDRWHIAYIYNYSLAWFSSGWPDWFSIWTVWLSRAGMLLSALAARSAAPGASSVTPRALERGILTVFFVTTVAPVPASYVGLSVPLLTVPLVLAVGFLLITLGNHRSVLAKELMPGVPLRDVISESDRHWLIGAARKYRDLHSQLRRWEQGDQDGEREQLETKLDQLHRWNPQAASPHSGKSLPHSIDAVELALAWGPRATWWLNACRAASFAAVFALPATAVAFWADQVRGSLWGDMARNQFGVIGLVGYVIASEVIWASVGFVLGALWRVLPGRRGPAKGLGLTLVYAAPVAFHWIITHAIGQSFGTLALDVMLTLLVLTSTGVAMDIDTFRQEDHYWPTKMALVLSVYQLRTASVQLAFFVAQLVALVGVWQQLKGNDPTFLIQPQDPTSSQGGPPAGGSP
ncbi:DUF6185 family protein [Streptomyces sp. 039-1]|uniref:DUF6185 family protein n=1 Tax=Streptomyces sp. 039-1 TaxID=2789263 RepID=UPI0039F63013